MSTVTTAAGRLYVNSGYVTYALNEFDRSIGWQHDFNVELAGIGFIATLNPPAVSGGKTFVTTSPQLATWMYGFDASDGTPIFRRAFDSQAEAYLAPTVDNGEVFEDGGSYGGMYAFDANVGTQTFFTMLQQ
jgi:outer membrane protein assembly factor BamB